MSVTRLPDSTLGSWNLTSYGVHNMEINADNIKPIVTSTQGSQGVYKKFNLTIEDNLLYIKAGKDTGVGYSVREPIIECLVSRIGQHLGFPVVDYTNWVVDQELFDKIELMKMNGGSHTTDTSSINSSSYASEEDDPSPIYRGPSITLNPKSSLETTIAYYKKALVSVSETFNPGNAPYSSADILTKGVPDNKLFERLFKMGSQVYLRTQEMIIFDFLINNSDRHRKNFGFLGGSGDIPTMVPLFDHGLSLLSNFDDTTISEREYDVLNSSTGKSFTFNLLQDLQKYVDFDYIRLNSTINFDANLNDLYALVEDYKGALSPIRLERIKQLLEGRFNYVKGKILPS